MNFVRHLIAVCGLAGAIAVVALPFAAGIKAISVGSHGIILLVCFGVPLALGGLGAATGYKRWMGIVTLLTFLVAGMKSTGSGGQSGQTVCLFAAFLGAVISILVIITPGKKESA